MRRLLLAAALVVLALVWMSQACGGPPPFYTTQANGLRLGAISPGTGAGLDVGPFGISKTFGIAVDDATGELFAVVRDNSAPTLARVDPLTGAASTIGTGMGTSSSTLTLEIGPDGTIYAAAWDRTFYTVDRTTGVATLVGTMGSEADRIMDMAFDPTSGTLWGTVARELFTIDPATGATTPVSTISGITAPMGIAFDDAGTLYATNFSSLGEVYLVDPVTGAATLLGVSGFDRPHGGDIRNTPPPAP